jgi:hypothetical protein
LTQGSVSLATNLFHLQDGILCFRLQLPHIFNRCSSGVVNACDKLRTAAELLQLTLKLRPMRCRLLQARQRARRAPPALGGALSKGTKKLREGCHAFCNDPNQIPAEDPKNM